VRPLLCLCLLLGREKKFYVEIYKQTRSAGRSRIFWIFYMKSVELVKCDSDFLVRGCSVCARKWDKLYVGECMALTIGLSGMFGLYF